MDVVVSGATGRMGRALAQLIAEADDVRAVGGIARVHPDGDGGGYPVITDVAGAGDILRSAALVIDFSAPAQLRELIDAHADALAGRGLLVGTTDLGADLDGRLDQLAGGTAVLVAPNFSVGVNLLLGLVERAARALAADAYDVEIVEAHHGRKEDAPSGTALALGRAAATGRGVPLEDVRRDGRSGRAGARPAGEIGFHALRGGGVVGDHAVHFLGARERIVISHRAESRELFAEGALVAARWLAGQGPGRYTMAHVLDFQG